MRRLNGHPGTRRLLAGSLLLASGLGSWGAEPTLPTQPTLATLATQAGPAQASGADGTLLHPALPKAPTQHQRDEAQKAYAEGAKAVQDPGKVDLGRAVERFERAASLDPANTNYSTALTIARQDLVTQLIQQAQKAKLRGDQIDWRAKLTEAVRIDAKAATHNPMIAEHVDELARENTPREPVLQATTDDAGPPVELEPRAVAPQDFHLVAPRDQIVKKVYEAFGITALIDKSIEPGKAEDTRVHFDQDGVTFAEARQAAELATNTFAVALDPHRVLVALDNKENRTAYERFAQETIYLPGLTSVEMTDMGNVARNLFDAQQTSVDENAHTLVVRAPQGKLKPLNLMLTQLMEGRSEVVLDLNVYEITRTRAVTEGAELPTSSNIFNVTSEVNKLISANPTLVQQIISAGLATPGNYQEIALALILSGQAGSTLLSQPFAIFGGGLTTTGLTLTQAAANLTLNVSDTRVLDQVQLRLLDQEEGTLRVGERYPIITSSYSNLASGSTSIAGISAAGLSNTLANLGVNLSALTGAAAATVPQVQYQDLGLTLHATSRVQHEQDVSLKLDLQLTSLAGSALNGNPVLNSRQYQSIVTIKPGEKALLVSSLSTQESASLIGLPFLSEIPGFTLGTSHTVNTTRSSLVIVITPRVVRLSHRTPAGPMVLMPQHS